MAVWWGPCRLACTLWVPGVAGGLEVLEVAVCGPKALQVEGELAGLEPGGGLQQPIRLSGGWSAVCAARLTVPGLSAGTMPCHAWISSGARIRWPCCQTPAVSIAARR